MHNIENFLGKWKLSPEEALYEFGTPPSSGTYEIIKNGETLIFNMEWMDSKGESHNMSYSEICDGNFHELKDVPVADELRLTLKSNTLLESDARKNGVTVMSAQRELVTVNILCLVLVRMKPTIAMFRFICV
ncbi:MAG: hypothetical protein COA96_04070 [SAR86 cluster bacterium]|uniref:Lipocalin-like domain-containing protein n=1 Tax=SAR86 cluster bacterium TaxID=2030880 RepID=A0A2A5B6E0_9GAMM|nr:MAG: hypothetical protein COA96_04070 [SAR86 cluster bacterium]